MIFDVILIDTHGSGFQEAEKETLKAAAYGNLNPKDTMRLLLCAEEMLSMVRSVTGEPQASFWIESEDKKFELHLSAKTAMDKEKRAMLISASTSRKNEAANTFLGKVLDAFERAMAAEPDHGDSIPQDILPDLPNHIIEENEWDGYERSILKNVSSQVKVGIRGGKVELIVVNEFE